MTGPRTERWIAARGPHAFRVSDQRRGHLLHRLGRRTEAGAACRRALALTTDAAEIRWIGLRLTEILPDR